MSLIQAIILAIVEGITEFLPISSTGHMIIASSIMGIEKNAFTTTFIETIQFGAIFSVVLLYWRRFLQSFNFYVKLLVAFLPFMIVGFLFKDQIEVLLKNVIVVAISFVAGGIILLFIDKLFNGKTEEKKENVSTPAALKIGLFQVLALIPGVSRSAATIIGGLSQRLTRKAAAEFSFFLAVPTMFVITAYKMYEIFVKEGTSLEGSELKLLITGNVIAFIVAIFAIRSFIDYLSKYGFKLFGYYRIVIGLLIIILYLAGIPLSIV
jgi:undecaprenyl-diphosphatase